MGIEIQCRRPRSVRLAAGSPLLSEETEQPQCAPLRPCCFGSSQVYNCNEVDCPWRERCRQHVSPWLF